MNYKLVHEKFINYVTTTTPEYRLNKRNQYDLRIHSNEKLYLENHHIVPRSIGGYDTADNLVNLLPEEHIFVHYLRWKAFKNHIDLCAVNFMISGFDNVKNNCITKVQMNKIIRQDFSRKRIAFGKFISKHNKGHPAISAARKGKMPVKDANTGIIIGSVPTNDPRVISGEWIHHSTGRKMTAEQRKVRSILSSGAGNPNYYKISNKEYLDQTVEYIRNFTDNGRFIKCQYKKYCIDNDFVYIINFSSHRFDGLRENFIDAIKDECAKLQIPFVYDRFYRSQEQKKNLSKLQSSKMREYRSDGTFYYKVKT